MRRACRKKIRASPDLGYRVVIWIGSKEERYKQQEGRRGRESRSRLELVQAGCAFCADKKNPGAIATIKPGHQTRNGYINKCFTAKTNYGVCKLADI